MLKIYQIYDMEVVADELKKGCMVKSQTKSWIYVETTPIMETTMNLW